MHWNSIGTDVAGKWNTKVELSVLLLRGIREGYCNKVVVWLPSQSFSAGSAEFPIVHVTSWI